tara:strand:- start:54 stop:1205 length:1152 start_codon:yes stop_codon:yes gene_type:complete
MKHIAKFLLILIITNSYSCFSQKVVEKKINSDSLKIYVNKIIAEYEIPGIQAALVSGDKILNVVAEGVKKIDGDSISVNSKMHLGSCGKAMTGYLAGILVQKKLLNWNTNIKDVFPEFKSEINQEFMDLTLKSLLSHQSKIPQFITGEDWKLLDRFVEKDPKARRYAFAKWILKKEAVPFDSTETNAGFRYSNAGYSIAAAMMEKVTNNSWEQLMKDEVFEPLGIDAIFGWPARTDKSEPFGHIINEKNQTLIPHNPNDEYKIDPILSPSGNISMSVLDYIKFIQKNLNGLNGFDNEYPKDFFEFLHYTNRPESEYSIGWYSVEQFDDNLSSHTGSADTFYCLNFLLRKHNIAVIVIANSATEQTKNGAEKIRNYLIRPYLKD